MNVQYFFISNIQQAKIFKVFFFFNKIKIYIFKFNKI